MTKNKNITVFVFFLILMLNLVACGSTSAKAVKADSEVEVKPLGDAVFTSVYSGFADDGKTTAWLGVTADGSCAVLSVFDTSTDENRKWYGEFSYDGTSAEIKERNSGASVTFGYETDGKGSYLINLERYGRILISEIEPYYLV